MNSEHHIELVRVDCYRPGHTIKVRVDGHETTYTMSEGDTLIVDDNGRMSVRHPG